MRHGSIIVMTLCSLMMASPVAAPEVSQQEIDAAIKKGADWLVQRYGSGVPESNRAHELILYALIHADVDPAKVPALKNGIEKLITLEPQSLGGSMTYRCAIQALALHSLLLKVHRHPAYAYLDPRIDAIQERVATCGQYLVDTQSENGQWSYRGTLVNKPEKNQPIKTGSSAKEREKIRKRPPSGLQSAGAKLAWESAIDITGTVYILKPKFGENGGGEGTVINPRRQRGEGGGDNSNTQYGILGLIAAQMSGCIVPDSTWQKSLEWFEKCQIMDEEKNIATGSGRAGGFGYGGGGKTDEKKSYGSMTTAGAVGLAACYRYLQKDPKKKDFTKKAALVAVVNWLDQNFTVSDNPGLGGQHVVYYYLYGMERVGAFMETDTFGKHKWYDEGAEWLVKNQQADGSWPLLGEWDKKNVVLAADINACFAILFLKRATKEIIETGTGGGNPPVIEQK